MLKISRILFVTLFLSVCFLALAHAGPYSSMKVFKTFGNENICLGAQSGCLDGSGGPDLDTAGGYHFEVIPIGVRQPIIMLGEGELGVRLESVLSFSRREFNVEYSGRGGGLNVTGDDTRYGMGGQMAVDYKTKFFTPYVGAGAGVEYAKYSSLINCRGECRGLTQLETHSDFVIYGKGFAGVDIPVAQNVSLNVEGFYKHADRVRDVFPSQANANLDGEFGIGGGLTLYY